MQCCPDGLNPENAFQEGTECATVGYTYKTTVMTSGEETAN
jgi:hypothetical protein